MSTEDNSSLQTDEIEALASIYGEEWCVVDEDSHIYCIQVDDGQDRSAWTVNIQVHLPENYPLDAPPEYQLNAPWLRGEERRNLEGALADVYCENMGESIVFLWVERIREFLQQKTSSPGSSQPGIECGGSRMINVTEETDHGDDDFDLDLVTSDGSDHGSDTSSATDCECPPITHGRCFTDRRSTFQPHVATIVHKSQIKMVLDKLYENKKIANATHNIMAYRMVHRETHTRVQQGCDDDGETHAGSRMLHLLNILEVENVIVVVSRWFGGILLGADRFKHINNCTREILNECGFITKKEEKKGPKSGSEKKKR